MLVAQGRPPDLPGYGARTFTLMPVGSTSQRSVQVSGFADICLLTPLRRLYPLPVRQASALPSASSGFAVTRDTLAVRLTLLLAECVEDFHLQVRAPCRAHKKKRGVASTTPRQNRPPACAVPTVILNLGSRGSPTRTIRRFRVGSAHRSIRARRPRYRSIGSKSVWPARTPQGTNVAVEQAVDNFRKAFPAPPSHDRWLSAWRKFYAEWPRCQNR